MLSPSMRLDSKTGDIDQAASNPGPKALSQKQLVPLVGVRYREHKISRRLSQPYIEEAHEEMSANEKVNITEPAKYVWRKYPRSTSFPEMRPIEVMKNSCVEPIQLIPDAEEVCCRP